MCVFTYNINVVNSEWIFQWGFLFRSEENALKVITWQLFSAKDIYKPKSLGWSAIINNSVSRSGYLNLYEKVKIVHLMI